MLSPILKLSLEMIALIGTVQAMADVGSHCGTKICEVSIFHEIMFYLYLSGAVLSFKTVVQKSYKSVIKRF